MTDSAWECTVSYSWQEREQFGPRWPVVESVLEVLRLQHGLFFTDVSPDNIAFLDSG